METLCKSGSPSPQALKDPLLLLNPLKVKAAQGSGEGRECPRRTCGESRARAGAEEALLFQH